MTSLLAGALPSTIEEIGAIAGIASFLVMLGLFGLYFYRALELRRLRRSMPFLVNPGNGNGKPAIPPRRGRKGAGTS